ncbi:Hypothetical protein NTJ_11052 [Nesidiocoris tenuis]|uniref:AGC-kinase C-terminal domain-containing protein n=1 Tax=Nesidiocoris tenuis TaxID=355587 RepID=A0ABN7B3M3_9HEMI|nr:Hypothetical protein NTJ_11052 [Nesidiocoris tenuis]
MCDRPLACGLSSDLEITDHPYFYRKIVFLPLNNPNASNTDLIEEIEDGEESDEGEEVKKMKSFCHTGLATTV